jgi:ADP-dependent NAD(P)H-hydrate dehydratase
MELSRVNSLVRLPARESGAHKGQFGRVLVVGGSTGMVGAPALAANAALRGGAGLVTVATPADIQQTVAGLCPCATSIPLAISVGGRFTSEVSQQFRDVCDTARAIAIGPGLGDGTDRDPIVEAAIRGDLPVVLDADGLNVLARQADWPNHIHAPTIITPHPGEFARLAGEPVGASPSEREAAAIAMARRVKGDQPFVVLLKGAGTVVTDGDRIYTNTTGNPGMATGGSGDVLTGLIAALVAQGIDLFEAGCLGAFVHGRAGDLAAATLGQASMTAEDLLTYLPDAVQEIAD